MRHKRKAKLLFYVRVKCMCDGKLMVTFQKYKQKKTNKGHPKRNTGKLIKTGGSN